MESPKRSIVMSQGTTGPITTHSIKGLAIWVLLVAFTCVVEGHFNHQPSNILDGTPGPPAFQSSVPISPKRTSNPNATPQPTGRSSGSSAKPQPPGSNSDNSAMLKVSEWKPKIYASHGPPGWETENIETSLQHFNARTPSSKLDNLPTSMHTDSISNPFTTPDPPLVSETPGDWNFDATKPLPRHTPLGFLKQYIPSVRSQLDLRELFGDIDLSLEDDFNNKVGRTPRSTLTSRRAIELARKNLDGSDEILRWPDTRSYQPRFEHEPEESSDLSLEYDYQGDEPDMDIEAYESALYHMEEWGTSTTIKCKEPEPYVLSMEDPHDRSKIFLPPCIEVHRCMNHSGCCGFNGVCVPKSINVITKAFFVIHRWDAINSELELTPEMATMIAVDNHTECECRPNRREPARCTKSCPAPFKLTRDGDNCNCTCEVRIYEEDWRCEVVKEGVHRLSQEGLICIKKGQCYTPTCAVGIFDVKTGYCPLSDKYNLKPYHFDNPEDRYHYRKHLKDFDPTTAAKMAWARHKADLQRRTSKESKTAQRTTRKPLKNVDSKKETEKHNEKMPFRGNSSSQIEASAQSSDEEKRVSIQASNPDYFTENGERNASSTNTKADDFQTSTVPTTRRRVGRRRNNLTAISASVSQRTTTVSMETSPSSINDALETPQELQKPQELRDMRHSREREVTRLPRKNNNGRIGNRRGTRGKSLNQNGHPRLGLDHSTQSSASVAQSVSSDRHNMSILNETLPGTTGLSPESTQNSNLTARNLSTSTTQNVPAFQKEKVTSPMSNQNTSTTKSISKPLHKRVKTALLNQRRKVQPQHEREPVPHRRRHKKSKHRRLFTSTSGSNARNTGDSNKRITNSFTTRHPRKISSRTESVSKQRFASSSNPESTTSYKTKTINSATPVSNSTKHLISNTSSNPLSMSSQNSTSNISSHRKPKSSSYPESITSDPENTSSLSTEDISSSNLESTTSKEEEYISSFKPEDITASILESIVSDSPKFKPLSNSITHTSPSTSQPKPSSYQRPIVSRTIRPSNLATEKGPLHGDKRRSKVKESDIEPSLDLEPRSMDESYTYEGSGEYNDDME